MVCDSGGGGATGEMGCASMTSVMTVSSSSVALDVWEVGCMSG